MTIRIRRVRTDEIEDVVQLSLVAWAPVFTSFEQVLGAEIFARLYPDWRTGQRAVVERICEDRENSIVWVAEVDGTTAGFIAYALNTKDSVGEVQLLAVHPEYQNRGRGTELSNFALRKMKEGGDENGRRGHRWRSIARTRQKIIRKGWVHRTTLGSVL